MRCFARVLCGLAESIRRIGKTDSKKPFYPEQLENEACPNHLHSSRAVSVHAYILCVGYLSPPRAYGLPIYRRFVMIMAKFSAFGRRFHGFCDT